VFEHTVQLFGPVCERHLFGACGIDCSRWCIITVMITQFGCVWLSGVFLVAVAAGSLCFLSMCYHDHKHYCAIVRMVQECFV
jgi:hypothetical protein